MIKIATNNLHKNKDGGRTMRFNCGFINKEMTIRDVAIHVWRGYSITSPHKHVRHVKKGRFWPDGNQKMTSFRVKKNFICSQHVWLDFDGGVRIEEVINDEWITRNAGFVYTSSSHTEDKHKFRLCFFLREPVTDIDEYENIVRSFLYKFDGADQSAKDATRVFFGSEGCKVHYYGNLASSTFVKTIVSEYNSHIDKLQADIKEARFATEGNRINVVASDTLVSRYLAKCVDNAYDELSSTLKGSPTPRHQVLISNAMKLKILSNSIWTKGMISESMIVACLRSACMSNGYIRDYGEQEVERAIMDAFDYADGKQLEEPNWRQHD